MTDAPHTRRATAADSDTTKLELLAAAVEDPRVRAAAEQFRPGGDVTDVDGNVVPGSVPAPAEWQPSVTELAAAVRMFLPGGLAADDFDGQNIEEVLSG